MPSDSVRGLAETVASVCDDLRDKYGVKFLECPSGRVIWLDHEARARAVKETLVFYGIKPWWKFW